MQLHNVDKKPLVAFVFSRPVIHFYYVVKIVFPLIDKYIYLLKQKLMLQ